MSLQNHHPIMKKLLTIVSLCACMTATAQVERPKLVVGIVVDQMRWDYLYYYNNEYCEGGIKRLVNEGFSFEDTQISHAPSTTAIGHTSIYTGSVPALHGIAGNYFRQGDKEVYCCEDPTVSSVGSDSEEGRMSPRRMLATTIGDELRLSTDFRSRVFSVALKDRAAILPAGHSADGVFWWDTSAGHFVSSTFYMDELPQYVQDFNKEWAQEPGFNIKASNIGVTTTFRLAEAVLRNEHLGKGDVTDMLCVSISSTDAIGHLYSTHSKEIHDVFIQLDTDIAKFLDVLDTEIGRDNYLLFLTADHGASHNYNYLNSHRIPAGAWEYDKATDELNAFLSERFGTDSCLVLGEDNYQFFLDDKAIRDAGLKKQDVIDEAISFLKEDETYLYVVDGEKIGQATMPAEVKERLVNGYFRGRSGEIQVVTRPQHFGAENSPYYIGTQHGQPLPYDTHIPFVLMGRNVEHGASVEPVKMCDIAATVCSMLHIQAPDACIGHPKKVGND